MEGFKFKISSNYSIHLVEDRMPKPGNRPKHTTAIVFKDKFYELSLEWKELITESIVSVLNNGIESPMETMNIYKYIVLLWKKVIFVSATEKELRYFIETTTGGWDKMNEHHNDDMVDSLSYGLSLNSKFNLSYRKRIANMYREFYLGSLPAKKLFDRFLDMYTRSMFAKHMKFTDLQSAQTVRKGEVGIVWRSYKYQHQTGEVPLTLYTKEGFELNTPKQIKDYLENKVDEATMYYLHLSVPMEEATETYFSSMEVVPRENMDPSFVLDCIDLNNEKNKVLGLIDDAIDSGNQEEFQSLSEYYNSLLNKEKELLEKDNISQ